MALVWVGERSGTAPAKAVRHPIAHPMQGPVRGWVAVQAPALTQAQIPGVLEAVQAKAAKVPKADPARATAQGTATVQGMAMVPAAAMAQAAGMAMVRGMA